MPDNPFVIRPITWTPADHHLPDNTPAPEGWALIALKGSIDFDWSLLPVYESCPVDLDGQRCISTACMAYDAECFQSWMEDHVILGGTSDTLVR